MGWVDVFEIPRVPCCSARGEGSTYVLIDNNDGPTLSGGASFTKIPLSYWQNFTDTNEVYFSHDFTEGGITINKTGNYMISANIAFNYRSENPDEDPDNNPSIGKDYGVYVLTGKKNGEDEIYTEVLSAHYFNERGIGDTIRPQGVCTGAKIIEIEDGTTVYLCGRTKDANKTVKAYIGEGSTYLSIIKV